MKATLVLLLAGGLPALAAVPAKKPLDYYQRLWTHSVICSPKPVDQPPPSADPFVDWTLGGVSAISDGYLVTLIHRQRPDEMRLLRSSQSGEFAIESVAFGKDSWKATTVTLNCAGIRRQLSFEDALIRPKSSSAPANGIPAVTPVTGKRLRTLPTP